ncbi:MAG: hypothetical protein VKJ04_05665 [Vampirovibrionales bacterium]|nr:hypothetical protein [Vampirovibrionales bacterium]
MLRRQIPCHAAIKWIYPQEGKTRPQAKLIQKMNGSIPPNLSFPQVPYPQARQPFIKKPPGKKPQEIRFAQKDEDKKTVRKPLWQTLPKGFDSDPLPPGGGYKVPSQWEYYQSGLKKHFIKGQQEGSERFLEEVRYNKKKRWGLFLGVTGLIFILTAASTPLRKLLHVGILAALLPIPIVNANRTIPKLSDAYKVARQGNPQKADRMFNTALREFNYSLFQDFLKPVSLALVFTTLLGLPQSFAKPKTEWLKLGTHYLKKTANRYLKTRYPLNRQIVEGLESRSMVETAICSPLEKLNLFKAPKSKTAPASWSKWTSEQLERLGWKHDLQPYPLLRRLNLFLRKHGDRWEDWLRRFPLMERLLGKKHGISAREQLPGVSTANEASGPG